MDSSLEWKRVAVASLVLAISAVARGEIPQIQLACGTIPTSIYPGESVTVHAIANSVSTKRHVNVLYKWSGAGVTGEGATAHVATADSMKAGTYSVSAEVLEGKPGKEGQKPGESATCSASYTVKEFEPPTVSCSATPSTIMPDSSGIIECKGTSPQNRPLTYSYSTSAGTIHGTGIVAIFSGHSSTPSGPITVTCSVEDDNHHSASTQITIMIQAPPPPLQSHVRTLCSLSFGLDKKHPTRLDDQGKACLNEIALSLQADPDAKVVLAADSTAAEKEETAKQETLAASYMGHGDVQYFAGQRAVNAKDYLVRKKGIDASRVVLAIGSGDSQMVHNFLVPACAAFNEDMAGTNWINETEFTPEEHHTVAWRPRAIEKGQ